MPRTKTVKKRIPPERDLQKALITYARRKYPSLAIFSNPMSELEFHNMSDNYRKKIIASLKAQGWEKSNPDTHFAHGNQHYSSLSIELKRTEKEMPLYWKPRKQCYEVENARENGTFDDKVIHLRNQARKLHDIAEGGGLAVFEYDLQRAKDLLDWYMDPLSHPHINLKIEKTPINFYDKYTGKPELVNIYCTKYV